MTSNQVAVGDRFKMVIQWPNHGILGEVYTVVKVPSKDAVILDRCNCNMSMHNPAVWPMITIVKYFEKCETFTEEDMNKAIPMPDPMDVLGFLKR